MKLSTERQNEFIRELLTDRIHYFNIDPDSELLEAFSRRSACHLIDLLLACPALSMTTEQEHIFRYYQKAVNETETHLSMTR